jgi:hypothetical protein
MGRVLALQKSGQESRPLGLPGWLLDTRACQSGIAASSELSSNIAMISISFFAVIHPSPPGPLFSGPPND